MDGTSLALFLQMGSNTDSPSPFHTPPARRSSVLTPSPVPAQVTPPAPPPPVEHKPPATGQFRKQGASTVAEEMQELRKDLASNLIVIQALLSSLFVLEATLRSLKNGY